MPPFITERAHEKQGSAHKTYKDRFETGATEEDAWSDAEVAIGCVGGTASDTSFRPLIARGATLGAIVYGLVDPREPGRIRYVGQTTRAPIVRLSQHLRERKVGQRKCEWVARLDADGVAPDMVLLQRLRPTDDHRLAEGWWIATLRSRGEADMNTNAVAGFLAVAGLPA